MFFFCFGVCLFFSFSFPRLCAVNIDTRKVLIDVIKGKE